jgi:signal transduction histidine kinase
VAEGRLREGDVARMAQDMQRVRTTAEQANAEVRAEIAGLRLLTERDVDLIARMRAYIEDFEDQTDIVTTFTLQGNATHATLADPGLQLVRILQEALANVRKHSQATAVDVLLRLDRSGAELIVEDNGCGLPHERSEPQGLARHFGLATMRERAESQGGELRLLPASTYRSGTRVQVAMPLSSTFLQGHLNGGIADGAATTAAG